MRTGLLGCLLRRIARSPPPSSYKNPNAPHFFSTVSMMRALRQKLTIKPPDFKSLVHNRELEDLLAMVKSYLISGKLELAETLLNQIQKDRMKEWFDYSQLSNDEGCGFLNLMIQAYLDRDEPRQAMEQVSKQLKHRNSLSFALFLKYWLGKGKIENCRQIMNEMRLAGLPLDASMWDHFVQTRVLRRAEVRQLIPLIQSIEGNSAQITVDLEGILAEEISDEDSKYPCISTINLDQVKSINSNSHGIDYVKRALRSLKSTRSNADLYALQETLEHDCLEAASEQFKEEMAQFLKMSKSPNHSKIKRLLCDWHPQLISHYRSILDMSTTSISSNTNSKSGNDLIIYSALLSSLPADKISIIVLQELTRINGIDNRLDGIPVARIATNIGSCLEREIFAQQVFRKEFLAYVKLNPKQRNQILHNRRTFTKLMERTREILDDSIEARQAGWIPSWSTTMKAEVGTFVAIEAIKRLQLIPEEGAFAEAAFTHELVTADRKRFGVIKLHPKLLEALKAAPELIGLDPCSMPMVVPPNPWLSYNQGGYLTQKQVCVRLKDDPVHLSFLHSANAKGKMEGILHGLDVLGQTSWRINEKILEVAIALWNGGTNVATHQRPPPDRVFEYRPKETFEAPEQYRAYVAERAAYIQECSQAHSTMCDTNYKLEIARQFSGIPFYLPHSVDFRGRAYPIPPHLSHIGSDLSRGLLVFSEGKPLGERGLFWLKVQLANMFGFDKHPLNDRAQFVDNHLEMITDSAKNPLTGKQWWKEADEPWQCLAACMELEAALSSGDPHAFVSSFPVQQDGSCNGLQHYAALGRDVGGAIKVNLAPSDRPQDIYAAVANLVNEKIEKDSALGVPIALKLRGKINRKIIKQPVMTNVYGVTPFGARAQIQERLKEFNVVPKEDYMEARKYLANEVFSSLKTLFVKARMIQDWLTLAAEEISRSVPADVAIHFGYKPDLEVAAGPDGRVPGEKYRTPIPNQDSLDPFITRYPQTSVSWDTPLGFRVVQPYLKTRMVHLKTVIQTLSLRSSDKLDPVDIGKQVSAFPPNFVHSLDATHMFMTAMACFDAGITFASVHDCFWTHAATVDQMNGKIREQFVSLYLQPVLQSLRDDFLRFYGSYKVPIKVPIDDGKYVAKWRHINIPAVPEQGDFDIRQVLGSQYFFS